MQGINFGMDGLSLDGTTWYNPDTGDSFKVRSNFFEDNNMILQTTDGRRISLDKMDGYVQWQGSGQPPKGPLESPKQVKQDIPTEILAELASSDNPEDILPEDLALISGASPVSPRKQPESVARSTQNPNHDIIDRALKKTKTPDWSVVMKWPKFPENEITLLHTVMDIPMDEIADYYMGCIQDEFNEFMNNIRSQITDYIQSKLRKDEPPTTTKDKTPQKTTDNKTKTKK